MTFVWQTCVSRKQMWERKTVVATSQRLYTENTYCINLAVGAATAKFHESPVSLRVVGVVDAFALRRTLQSIVQFHLYFDLYAFCLVSRVDKR
jgi:hypothetical protein